MEENVPLEPESKKKFDSTVADIKRLIKSGKFTGPSKDEASKLGSVINKGGVVYIGHIPHGFYEEQMRGFFKQFGKVTNVRVARSKKNGGSKGYGFVEFADRDVAQIVAETMNNYLMDKRLLKAEVLPEERDTSTLFKGKPWVKNERCPTIFNRKESIKKYNKEVSHEEWIEESKKQLNRLYKLKSKLEGLGINFNFTPVDVPEELLDYDPSTSVDIKSDKKEAAKDGKQKKGYKEKTTKPGLPAIKVPSVKSKASPGKFVKKNKSSENSEKQKLNKQKGTGGVVKKSAKKGPLSQKLIFEGDDKIAKTMKALDSSLVKIVKKDKLKKKAGKSK